jgi:phosphoribosylanthranilate isomerase
MIETYDKQNYLNEVEKLKILEESIKKTQKSIDNNFIKYYRAEKPADVEALEKYLDTEIDKLFVMKYEDDFDNWCDVVLVKTKDEKIITFDISRSDHWETDEEAIILEGIKDQNINKIISDIFEDFPYISVEHL